MKKDNIRAFYRINCLIAKAGDKLHKRILEKLDVDEIVLPEEYMGIMTAKNILES